MLEILKKFDFYPFLSIIIRQKGIRWVAIDVHNNFSSYKKLNNTQSAEEYYGIVSKLCMIGKVSIISALIMRGYELYRDDFLSLWENSKQGLSWVVQKLTDYYNLFSQNDTLALPAP